MIIGIIGHTFNLIHSSWGYPIFNQSLLSSCFAGGGENHAAEVGTSIGFYLLHPVWTTSVESFMSRGSLVWSSFVHFSATTVASTATEKPTLYPRSHFMAVSFHYTSGFFSPGGPGVVSFHFHMPWGPWREWQSWSFLQHRLHPSALLWTMRPAIRIRQSGTQLLIPFS